MNQDRTRSASPIPLSDPDMNVALAQVVAEQIGPRRPGVVYDTGAGIVKVLRVVTDPSEARRILKRRAAQFAIEVEDLDTSVTHITGAVWTGSDRVLKAVA
ncbi:hypothetical protein [Streptomyces lavendulocolor]|uniref:hypothetical protein n=1 Tax=Streptomyces lavendulocolor TaxID=67316 RepID=UPI003C2D9D19